MKKLTLVMFLLGCTSAKTSVQTRYIGENGDPSPVLTFIQQGTALGLIRSNEPPSASSIPQPAQGTLAYGTFLADFDGDGDVDVYGVNHGQAAHRSGLWMNIHNSSFGQNLFTVGVLPAQQHPANLGLSNEIRFVGDISGDGLPDIYFLNWSGGGVYCANRGSAIHADWTGPSFACYSVWEPRSFGDVNGDGKPDMLTIDTSSGTSDLTYRAGSLHTFPMLWRLNNGNENPRTWPTQAVTPLITGVDPAVFDSLEFCDLNRDGIPDKVTGIPTSNRGPYLTSTGGTQVWIGLGDGSYALQDASGVENVTLPFVRVEDVNGDGCVDLGADITVYKDNQSWWLQNKVGTFCAVTFTQTARTAISPYPGARRYTADMDNDGLPDKVVLNHVGFGNGDNVPHGINVFRRQLNGTYVNTTPSQHGANITGTQGYEFYADQVDPGDWNNDGRIDLAGAGQWSIAGTDQGYALWTSQLVTTNKWLKVELPTVGGFFSGVVTIEIFDTGHMGDSDFAVTPTKVMRAGRVWPSMKHHFGVGRRDSVDVKVTFADGRQSVVVGAVTNTTVTITPETVNQPPEAVMTATPIPVVLGQPVSFSASQSSDIDGVVAGYEWVFGDGAIGGGVTESHTYAATGTYAVTLTVTDDDGATDSVTTTVTVEPPDTTPPTVSANSYVITASVSDDTGIASVTWVLDGVETVMSAPPYALTCSLPTGTHILYLRACDTSNNCTQSAATVIDVQ
jgi:hypothetical protein